MPQTRNPIFDDFARLMTDAAGMAHGARREVETLVRSQAERMLAGMDLVRREEFEAVRDMAILAREDNDRLVARLDEMAARLAELESRLAGKP